MKNIWVIFRKETLDSIRDTRSWMTGLFSAMFGPIMLGVLLVLLGSSTQDDLNNHLTLPVQGSEHAPGLIQFLTSQDVIIVPAPADFETAVKLGDVDVVLVIPEEFGGEFSSNKSATVQLVLDSSRQSTVIVVLRIQTLLEGYSSYIGKLRLIVRGVSPEVIEAIAIEEIDTATPQSQAMLLISMLPYFIIFVIFTGASPIIIDITAGERERKSLEPLLINPVPHKIFVVGKLLSAFPFSMASLALTLISFGMIFNIVPLEKFLGIQISLNVITLIEIFLLCLPVVFLASAIQMLVASFTRTTKEAGTYLPFIALIPSLPGLLLAFFSVKSNLWLMLIPTFGQQLLINQMMRQEPISILYIVVTVLATILVATIFTWLAILLYERENILFR
ncbi:MAG: ABC transporter permease [Anaerolineae bacterium]|jgi:sodium transport system permease protein|nr:ABC transporter permease [Anaerolineae bacterium]MBT7190917.1 ABC transporter permease [Anaerolineae bacterium]MBT7715544.1 ABC transporter permease [Deltaproteobacteria bacterium]